MNVIRKEIDMEAILILVIAVIVALEIKHKVEQSNK